MKRFFLLLMIIVPLLGYAQLNDGNYFFRNSDGVTCTINASGGGWTINVELKDGSKTYKGSGVFRNEHGLGWYEFQTPECNFEFDEPNDTITISRFDCKANVSESKYILTKSELSSSSWFGTYKNLSGGTLVISRGANESSFNFKLTGSGKSDCGGLEWSGSAKLSVENLASDNKDCPITLELNGNSIIFSMDMSCDYMVGMKCLVNFDGEFKK